LAVLGTVAGVLVAILTAPPPPVLRPTGLIAGSTTPTSLAFRWSGPPTGPLPNKYAVLRNGTRIASVPGNVTHYLDTGLPLASSSKYQVVAIRDTKSSPRSAILAMATGTPPISDAVLKGDFGANFKLGNYSGLQSWNGGKSWMDDWTFTPTCDSGPCGVTLDG